MCSLRKSVKQVPPWYLGVPKTFKLLRKRNGMGIQTIFLEENGRIFEIGPGMKNQKGHMDLGPHAVLENCM